MLLMSITCDFCLAVLGGVSQLAVYFVLFEVYESVISIFVMYLTV